MLERVSILIFLASGFWIPEARALMIEGQSKSGMSFKGEVKSLSGNLLHLESVGRGEALQMGIPLESIAQIQPLTGETNSPLLIALEEVLPLLPLWDQPTLDSLLKELNACADKGNWSTTYRWSEHLLEIVSEPLYASQLQLLKASALFEMGLLSQATQAAAALTALTDPLEAPLRLCWLNACLAERRHQTESARYWAELPSLQIPAKKGALADDLRSLSNRLTNSTR